MNMLILPDFTNLQGGCVCGALRYRVSDEPLALYVCHCLDCQKRSGASFSMAMIVTENAFAVTRGETMPRQKQQVDGHGSFQHYCPDCLVRTHTISPKRPNLVSVRPGTLDDTSWLEPSAQLWTKRVQPWLTGFEIKSFDEAPEDTAELAWQK